MRRKLGFAVLALALGAGLAAHSAARNDQWAAKRLEILAHRRDACVERTDGDPTALQTCSAAAVKAANELLTHTRANAPFEGLLTDLFEPLMFASTDGQDALAARVTVAGAFADLARDRAAILLDAAPTVVEAGAAPAVQLRQLGARGADFERRWAQVRAADCAGYPEIADCAARLDAAMGATLADLSRPPPPRRR